ASRLLNYHHTLLIVRPFPPPFLFFFNATPPTDIYTLSLHDALPIFLALRRLLAQLELLDGLFRQQLQRPARAERHLRPRHQRARSEEHTSELQSLAYLVCRLLLEKKKKKKTEYNTIYKQN